MKSMLGLTEALTLLVLSTVPVSAKADTISVAQVITITATVAPARSIVINDQGQMTKIFSNTSENVAPKVYRNKAPGPEIAMTPALQQQYDQIISKSGNKVGVAIDVPIPPKPVDDRLSSLLNNASIMTLGNFLHL